ncbi:MAG: gamma-glutamylcyclotransferase [Pseudomonadota bacterium]
MTEEKAIQQRPLWVFGYASLMWNPGFAVAERALATLSGYHRSFCMSSIHHRGTIEKPGLVLALDPESGARCTGLALRVPECHEAETVAYLRERELISSAYVERLLPLGLQNGETVQALAYVVDTEHEQYVAHLTLEEQAAIIATAVGGRGPNTEYLWNTTKHLEELGIMDQDLLWLSNKVRALTQVP